MHVLGGEGAGFRQLSAERELRGDRRGQRATRAVAFDLQARVFEFMQLPAVVDGS